MGVPQNGWFIDKIPLKWMIWGYPYDLGNPHVVSGLDHGTCDKKVCPKNTVPCHCFSDAAHDQSSGMGLTGALMFSKARSFRYIVGWDVNGLDV